MDVTPLIAPGQKVIHGYGKGFFRINGDIVRQPVIVCPDEVLVWDINSENIDERDFEPLIALAPEILLFGYGAVSPLAPPLKKEEGINTVLALKNFLKQQGISLDAMDTGAACRTYNVLMAEGRSVAAALIPVM